MDTKNPQAEIIEMFDRIAPTYDRANRVMSMGVDISWRKKACDVTLERLSKKELDLIVDVACGTGDMMGFWQKRADKKGVVVKKLLGIDPSSEMLKVAKKKFPNFNFGKSSADKLPLPNACAEILSISYGIRNVLDKTAAFKEFARVLKKGGYVVILEFTKDEKSGILHSLKRFYINKILPSIGAIISNNRAAYRYLPDSIDGFVTSAALQEELESVGFQIRYVKSFSMDISTLIVAEKWR